MILRCVPPGVSQLGATPNRPSRRHSDSHSHTTRTDRHTRISVPLILTDWLAAEIRDILFNQAVGQEDRICGEGNEEGRGLRRACTPLRASHPRVKFPRAVWFSFHVLYLSLSAVIARRDVPFVRVMAVVFSCLRKFTFSWSAEP